MSEIGVSVYPDLSPIEDIEAYLKLASKYGVTRVFSSMFSAEGTNEEILDYFRNFIRIAHENHMKVSLDVNPQFLTKLGVTPEDISLFHEIGCDILRLDMCYGPEKDYILCNNPYGIKIQLNASMGVAKELEYLKEKGITRDQLLLGHNFYPQRYTGLKWKSFLKTNEGLFPYGYPVDAFVASTAEGTHGVWDAVCGLPTVERMRDLPIDLQVRELLAVGIENILIGNAYASEEEFKAIQYVMSAKPRDIKDSPVYEMLKGFSLMGEQKPEKILKVVCDKDITDEERFFLFDVFPQTDWGDSSEWIWRSRIGRFLNKNHPVPHRIVYQPTFKPGDVVIVNDNYKHYAGEIQIVREPIINDGTRNRIGHLAPHEEEMFELIKDGDNVRFLEEK